MKNTTTGNEVVSSDFLKVLLALKANILKDFHSCELGIVVSSTDTDCTCKLLSNPNIRVIAKKISALKVNENDIALINFIDSDFRINLNKYLNSQTLNSTEDKDRHSINYGMIVANISNPNSGEETTITVVDNLTSTSTTDALSANQGRVLKNYIDDLITQVNSATSIANEAKSTADTAQTTANTANTNANTALDNADIALNVANEAITKLANKLEPSNIKAGENINVNVTGNDVTISSTGGGEVTVFPVGSIYASINNTSPASFFGGAWEALPEGRTLWTTTTDGQGGTLISAGLPNITGNALTVSGADTTAGGAMSKSGAQDKGPTGTGTGWRQSYIYFNARSSNDIYGNSSTVQPPAIRVYMWKRVS